jgi:hypothetical protein
MTDKLTGLICDQAQKIEADCDRASVRDSLASARWDRINLWLGTFSAAAAALAAFLAASNETNLNVYAAASALLSAILGSILTFLTPAKKSENFHKFSNRYQALRDMFRVFIAIRCAEEGDVQLLKKEFQALLAEKQKIDSDHPVIPERYYGKAVKIIQERIKRNIELKKLKQANKPAPESDTLRRVA